MEALTKLGRYRRRRHAEERALVILAMDLPYWITQDGGSYELWAEAQHAGAITSELKAYEAERKARLLEKRRFAHLHPVLGSRASVLSLFIYAWFLLGFFYLQTRGGRVWTESGMADSAKILHGEWWRALTALTLHADIGHLLANVAVGVLFAAGLLPYSGVGWTWSGILLSGFLGNVLNAWAHSGSGHSSLGASTAVFGALGMLVGLQIILVSRIRERPRHWFREIWFPLAAGLALFAFLGIGDGKSRVDVLAHFFGMLAGGCIGISLAFAGVTRGIPR